MTVKPTVFEALTAVMKDVGAVRKTERNNAPGGNYNFRGIDTVINACSPEFQKHGVLCIPTKVLKCERTEVEVGKNRTQMGLVAVEMQYTFYGPAGDSIVAEAPGEAFDSGDKGTAKAMSVALRTCLLQALCLPTDDKDPDTETHQRPSGRDESEPPPRREPDEPAPDLAALADAIFVAKDAATLRAIWKKNERALDAEHNGKTIRQRILDRQAAIAPPAEQAEVPAGAE